MFPLVYEDGVVSAQPDRFGADARDIGGDTNRKRVMLTRPRLL